MEQKGFMQNVKECQCQNRTRAIAVSDSYPHHCAL